MIENVELLLSGGKLKINAVYVRSSRLNSVNESIKVLTRLMRGVQVRTNQTVGFGLLVLCWL
jgi:glutamine amidotransferase PdxT